MPFLTWISALRFTKVELNIVRQIYLLPDTKNGTIPFRSMADLKPQIQTNFMIRRQFMFSISSFVITTF